MIERLDALKRRVVDTLSLVDSPGMGGNDPLQASNVISETSSHDFTSYLFAYEPLSRRSGLAILSADEGEMFLAVIVAALETGVKSPLVYAEQENMGPGNSRANYPVWAWKNDPSYNALTLARELYREIFAPHCAVQLATRIGGMGQSERTAFMGKASLAFRVKLSEKLQTYDWSKTLNGKEGLSDTLKSQDEFWSTAMSEALAVVQVNEARTPGASVSRTNTFGAARFTPFEAETVNFGLQLVYRQVWLPAGTQVGDIVKTIPLGPGQKEKVSIKTVRRSTTRQSFERNQAEERSSEMTSASKDSAEVVNEASSSSRWSAEVSAQASFGFSEASISASMGGETAASSRSAKNLANEAMQKAADKIRIETKVVISSETENSVSFERVSEISNNNDETAVTYVYSKMQRQYEVYTYLAEVNTVAFVAEPVVGRQDVTAGWIDRYADVLQSSLLDDRYVQDLERVLNRPADFDSGEVSELDSIDSGLAGLMDKLVARGLPDFSTSAGTPPDTVTPLLHSYLSERQVVRQRQEERHAFHQSLSRLVQHISQNALYYARRIWLSEDGDTRMMRYRNLHIPRDWRVINPVGRSYGGADPAHPSMLVPVVDGDNPMVSLTDIINPAGPTGLAGNYLVFDMRDRSEVRHIDAPISLLRQPYTRKRAWFEANQGAAVSAVFDPGFTYPSESVELELQITGHERDRRVKLFVRALDQKTGKRTAWEDEEVAVDDQGVFALKRLRGKILLTDVKATAPFTVMGRAVVTAELEDPDFAHYRWAHFANTLRDLEVIVGPAQLAELRRIYSAELEELGVREDRLVAGLPMVNREQLIELYLSHLFIQKNTRRVLLDTDNVVLSRITDNASSLEPFKAAHRQIDLLKAIEEVAQELRESQRLEQRLAEGMLDDPQVDTHIRVDGKAGISFDADG